MSRALAITQPLLLAGKKIKLQMACLKPPGGLAPSRRAPARPGAEEPNLLQTMNVRGRIKRPKRSKQTVNPCVLAAPREGQGWTRGHSRPHGDGGSGDRRGQGVPRARQLPPGGRESLASSILDAQNPIDDVGLLQNSLFVFQARQQQSAAAAAHTCGLLKKPTPHADPPP